MVRATMKYAPLQHVQPPATLELGNSPTRAFVKVINQDGCAATCNGLEVLQVAQCAVAAVVAINQHNITEHRAIGSVGKGTDCNVRASRVHLESSAKVEVEQVVRVAGVLGAHQIEAMG